MCSESSAFSVCVCKCKKFILSVIGIFVRVIETFYGVYLLFSVVKVNRGTYIQAVCSVKGGTLSCRQH